jgi:hypothetical protein
MSEGTPTLDVAVETTEGRVAVTAVAGSGQRSEATIWRSADAPLSAHVPIGTRDALELSMLADGSPVALNPGPGRLRRSSYRVTAISGDVTYELRPKDPTSSWLIRDGDRLGELTWVKETAKVEVAWHAGADVTAGDAALGCALAAAFGTGARFFLPNLLITIASLIASGF